MILQTLFVGKFVLLQWKKIRCNTNLSILNRILEKVKHVFSILLNYLCLRRYCSFSNFPTDFSRIVINVEKSNFIPKTKEKLLSVIINTKS